jgi:hypothetical protein
MEFERLLLLHDGYQLYQGPLKEITPYLSNVLKVKLGKY